MPIRRHKAHLKMSENQAHKSQTDVELDRVFQIQIKGNKKECFTPNGDGEKPKKKRGNLHKAKEKGIQLHMQWINARSKPSMVSLKVESYPIHLIK